MSDLPESNNSDAFSHPISPLRRAEQSDLRSPSAPAPVGYTSAAQFASFQNEVRTALATISESMIAIAAINKPPAAQGALRPLPPPQPLAPPPQAPPSFPRVPSPGPPPLPLAPHAQSVPPEELEARQREAMNVGRDERSFIDSLVNSINGANSEPDSSVSGRHNSNNSSSFTQFSALLPGSSGADGTDPLNAMRLALSSASRSRRPFRTAKELEEALTDVAKKSAQTHPGDTARISFLFAYSNFVSSLARENLDAAQAYHFHVAKEEQEGRHVICAPNGHFHAEAYTRHFLLSKTAPAAVAPSSSSSRKRARKKTTSPSRGRPNAATYPAGSCKNHPSSTTHDTDHCRSKKARSE